MTAAAQQRIINAVKDVPDEYEEQVIEMVVNFKVTLKKPESRLGAGGDDFHATDDIDFCNDEIEKMLTDVDFEVNPKKPVKRTFGALANDDFYIAPDFDSCFEDNPAAFGLEEYM